MDFQRRVVRVSEVTFMGREYYVVLECGHTLIKTYRDFATYPDHTLTTDIFFECPQCETEFSALLDDPMEAFRIASFGKT